MLWGLRAGGGEEIFVSSTYSSVPSPYPAPPSLEPPTPSAQISSYSPKYTRAGKIPIAIPSWHSYSCPHFNSLFLFKQNVITWLSAWAALWGFYSFQHSCAPGFDAAVHAACPSHSLAYGNVTFKCIFIFKLTSPRLYGIKEVLPKNMLLSIYKMKHMPPKVERGMEHNNS